MTERVFPFTDAVSKKSQLIRIREGKPGDGPDDTFAAPSEFKGGRFVCFCWFLLVCRLGSLVALVPDCGF